MQTGGLFIVAHIYIFGKLIYNQGTDTSLKAQAKMLFRMSLFCWSPSNLFRRNMNQSYETDDGIIKRWVVLTAEILGAEDLSDTDKILLAYISSFDEFYASNENTAEFLNKTPRTILSSKQKLERLGYLRVVKNTGRGKIYQLNYERLTENCQSDLQKTVSQTDKNLSPYNKDKIKEKSKGETENVEAVEKPATYGRADINEIVELWESETGIDIKSQANQRRQIYNLLRKFGLEATKRLVKRVGEATRSPDRFAPQIAVPSDLTGKYGKLSKLELWENRKKFARPFGQPQVVPKLRKANADYNGAWDEQTEDERAKVSEMMKKARSQLF